MSTIKASRGRPKSLNRDDVLDIAIDNYWRKGIDSVSINELCKAANVSKPALYREFVNEDGLMTSVLARYEKKVLAPILDIAQNDTPFKDTLNNMVIYVTSNETEVQKPVGCLLANMFEHRRKLGRSTIAQIERTHNNVLSVMKDWIEKSKANGELSTEMSSTFAATYINSQMSHAQCQLIRGEDRYQVRSILQVAMSVF